MKNLKIIFAGLILGFIISCGTTKSENQDNMETETLWMNSTKVDCMGVGPMTCYQIQRGDYILFGAWEYFYDKIEGFEYEPGYIYRLKVAVENLDPSTVPADASTKRYKLIEILKKEVDKRLLINDVWALTQIKGKDITVSDEKERPQLEINVAERRIAGKAVCNRTMGMIEDLTTTRIKFGPIGVTRKMCLNNMELENQYTKIIAETEEYTLEGGGQLVLKDVGGKEILRFKKVD